VIGARRAGDFRRRVPAAWFDARSERSRQASLTLGVGPREAESPTTSVQFKEDIVSRSRLFALSASASSLMLATAAHASVDLIAIGQLGGRAGDLSKETAAPLENGTASNLLGGVGSGIAYAGCHTFVAVPDRGPNL
jgi:hypothetical protein